MLIYKIIALTERISDRRNEKRDREESGIADHLPKRVKKSIPVNTFFKSGVLERVLQYTTYQEQKEWVRVLDKKSLLKMAKWVLPEKVQKQLAARVSESEGRLHGELNRYDLALIRLLNRYYTFVDEFEDGYDSDSNYDDDYENKAPYKNSQYLLNKAPFGFGIRCRYFELPELVEALLQLERVVFEYIPKSIHTHSLCKAAITQDPSNVEHIDPRSMTDKLCREALKRNADLLGHVPDHFRTRELCLLAFESPRHSSVLDDIPDEFKTEAMCLAEVQMNSRQLRAVPDALKTEEMCDLAIANWYRWGGSVLEYIPPRFRSFDRCVAAVNADDRKSLEGVPPEFITEDFFLAFVKLDGNNLRKVPEAFQTEAVMFAAVRQDVDALRYVPVAQQTKAIHLEVVRKDGLALRIVNDGLPEPEIYLEAVQQNGKALKYVPVHRRTDAIFLAAVNQNPAVFDDIPERLKTKERCISAVRRHFAAVLSTPDSIVEDPDYADVVVHLLSEMVEKGQDIPVIPPVPFITEAVAIKLVTQKWRLLSHEKLKSMKTEAVCSAALAQSWEALKFVPEKVKTEKMCEDALEKDLSIIKHVPEKFQTEAFFLRLVQKRGDALEIVPEELRTPEICGAAVAEDAFALKFVPEEIVYDILNEM